jgi:SAM-dependent methyltransferase
LKNSGTSVAKSDASDNWNRIRLVWTGDARVARVARIVCDLSGGSVSGMRILDLAFDVGNFSLELAQLGAKEVVGVEGRDKIAAATEKASTLGLSNVRFEQGDVRDVSPQTHGTFDVVLCLGILYHLDTSDVFEFAENVAALTDKFAIVETQVSLSRKRQVQHRGVTYWGKRYPEDIAQTGASLDNPVSFWPTRASLFNLLRRVGFTTIADVQVPAVPEANMWQDHVCLVAIKGRPQAFEPAQPTMWPERLRHHAHPTQGLRWRLGEGLQRLRGRGIPSLFRRP